MRRELLTQKAVALWVGALALIAAGTVSVVVATHPGGGTQVLHGRGTSPAQPAGDSDTNNGTGSTEQLVVGGSQFSPGDASGPAGPSGSATHQSSHQSSNSSSAPQTGSDGHGGLAPDSAKDAFGVVVGSLHGLYPGRVMSLPVTYQNPHSFAIRVIGARIAASLVSSTQGVPVCSSSHLAVTPWSSRAGIAVPSHSDAPSTLPVGLKLSAPDSCKSARWRVTVTAQAVR